MHGTTCTIKYVGTGTWTNKVKKNISLEPKLSGSGTKTGTKTGTKIDGIEVPELELEL